MLAALAIGSIGAPDRDWFYDDDGSPNLAQMDFVWSMIRARLRGE